MIRTGPGQQDRVAGTDEAAGGFHEDNRDSGEVHPGFRGMLTIVQAEREDVGRGDGGEETANAPERL